MKRPIIFLLLFLSLLTFSTPAKAYNFVVGGIYYNRISGTDKQVEVTSGTVKYSGAVVIPSTVENEGTTYSVTSIGSSAFSNCSELTSVIIPNSVTSIGNSAFFGCSALTSATIGEGVTTIGTSAFSDCSELTSVTIPNSVTSIEDFAFYRCSGLTSVTIGEGVTTIGFSAFSYCSGLESVTIPNSVTSIGAQAFLICSGLTSVTIGEGVTSIGGYAFDGCSSLTSVTIPENVTTIGSSAFQYCSELTSVEWNAINCQNFNRNSTIFPSNLTAITFGDKVAHIPAYLCYECSGLTSVTIPDSVTSIGDAAFYNCSGLTSVEWNAINCEDCAYYSTTFPCNLTTITFGDKVAHIPAYLCSGCSGLTSVTIPENVTSIGKGALGGIGLRSVEWNAINCKDFTPSSIAFPNFLTSITFGDKVEHIPAYLCYEWSGLTSVAIPNSVTSIGAFAFSGSGLTSVTIPENVTSVKKCAFSGCTGLRSVEWNAINCQDVDRASDRPFYECAKITAITFGNQVSHIPAFLCYEWSGLKSVTIPNSVTSIGEYAFSGCSGLTSVMIPNGVTTIDYGTFGRCSGLTSVTIGEGVASIGGSAFFGCSALTSVTIPENVTSIEDAAFYDCSDLTSVTSLAETPPSCSSDAFSVHDTLYVPCGCKTAYQTATGWLSFSKIIELECEDIVTDTLYFEFTLEEGETSATIEYSFSNTVLPGIEMEYYDGEAHSKFSPDAEGSITVNGNGHGRIYYTYAPGDTYGASFEPIEESAESLQAEDVRRDVRGG